MISVYCAGCGKEYKVDHVGSLAMSCTNCRCPSPILYNLEVDVAYFPASFHLVMRGIWPPGHFENYLGYSDHQSQVKENIYKALKSIGFTSQANCQDEECRKMFQRMRLEVLG